MNNDQEAASGTAAPSAAQTRQILRIAVRLKLRRNRDIRPAQQLLHQDHLPHVVPLVQMPDPLQQIPDK